MISTVCPEVLSNVISSYDGSENKVDRSYEGTGTIKYIDGHSYEGDFVNGKMSGQGLFKWKDETIYEGEMYQNKPQGRGKLLWPDGSIHSGEFKKGKRHGHGIFESRSNYLRYDGEWVEGKREGKGVLYYDYDFENERSTCNYIGEWKNDQRNGKGVMTYASGNIYEGEWKDDKRHGHGTMFWKDLKERYVGEWMEGQQSGKGCHTWLLDFAGSTEPSATFTRLPQNIMCNQYEGDWKGGERHGKGIFRYADGACYEGDWKNNLKHGNGMYIYSDGRVYRGKFVQDRMVDNEPQLESNPSMSKLRISMSIDELFADKKGVDAGRLRREVENILLRWNVDLQKIYYKCSKFYVANNPETGNAAQDQGKNNRESFTVTLQQLQHLLKICKVLPDGNLSLATVNRIVFGVINSKNPFMLANKAALHLNPVQILFREFVEVILRLANAKYSLDDSLPTVGLKLLRFFNEHLSVFLSNIEEDSSSMMVMEADATEDCKRAFDSCRIQAIDYVTPTDMIVTPRALIQRLRKVGIVGNIGLAVPIRVPTPETQPVICQANLATQDDKHIDADAGAEQHEAKTETPRNTRSKASNDSKSINRDLENDNEFEGEHSLDSPENSLISVQLLIDRRTAMHCILNLPTPTESPSVVHFQAEMLDSEMVLQDFKHAVERVADSIRANMQVPKLITKAVVLDHVYKGLVSI